MFSGFLENSTVHRACFRDTGATFIPVRGEKFTPYLRVNRFHDGMSFILQGNNINVKNSQSAQHGIGILSFRIRVYMRILSGVVTRVNSHQCDWSNMRFGPVSS